MARRKRYYGEEAEPVGFDYVAMLANMTDADILACEVEAPELPITVTLVD